MSVEGPGLVLEVDGQVIYDGPTPRAVTVAGVAHPFDPHGRVHFGGRSYRLVRVGARDCLAVVAAGG